VYYLIISVSPLYAPDTCHHDRKSPALFGIGIESLLARNADLKSFVNLLRLKIIWSASALTGLVLSFVQGYFTHIGVALLFIGIFLGFNILWVYWFAKVGNHLRGGR
jgi:hypothetical protein